MFWQERYATSVVEINDLQFIFDKKFQTYMLSSAKPEPKTGLHFIHKILPINYAKNLNRKTFGFAATTMIL